MQVSRSVVYAGAVAFLALFGAVFFLLGRESMRHRAPSPSLEPVAESVAPAAPAPAAAVPVPAPAAVPTPPLPSAPPSHAELAPPVASDNHPLPAVGAPADGSAAVRDYFARMQELQVASPTADTGAFANTVLTAGLEGDLSGFDQLVTAADAAVARAREISPPPPCADYHARLVALLGETATMIRSLKTAVGKRDTSALTALSGSAMALQSRANALEEQARALQQRYAR